MHALTPLVAVFIGGSLGAALRGIMPSIPGVFLAPTLLPNVLSCVLIGSLYAARHRLSSPVVLFSMTGFCGGLSTVSSLAHEVASGLAASASGLASAVPWVSLSIEVLLGLMGVFIGHAVAARCLRSRT